MLPTITIIALTMHIPIIPTTASMLTWNKMTRFKLCNLVTGVTASDTLVIRIPLSYPQAEYFVQFVP